MEGFLKLSTAVNITILMIDSANHVLGKTGLAAGLTITASKAGTYSSTPITPTVTELDATNAPGLYSLALSSTHANTLGELLLHITGAGADPTDVKWQISTYLPGEGATLSAAGIQAIWDALTSALTTTGSVGKRIADFITGDAYARLGAPAGASTAADIAGIKSDSGAIKTKTDFLPSATAGAAGGVFIAGSNAATTANITGNLTGNVTGSVGSVTGLTASDVGAIKAKTDNLPAAPADETLIISATNAIMSRLGAPAGASVSADVAAIQSDTDNLQTRLPAALVSGRIDASVGSYPGNTVQTGDAYARLGAPAGASVSADLAAVKVDTSAVKAKTDNLPASPAAVSDIPTAVANGAAVWDVTLASHVTSGSTGAALNAAGAAGDPWATALPGAYGAGTAGKILGTNLDVAVSSRTKPADTQASVTSVINDVGITQAAADKVWGSAARTLTSFGTLVADIVTAVWSATTRLLTAGTNIVLAKGTGLTGLTDLDAAGVRTAVGLAAANLDTQLGTIDAGVGTAISGAAAILARTDVATSTRLASGSYVVPDNTAVAAIKAKTDNLPVSPAATSDIPTAAQNADKLLGRSIAGGADGGRIVTDAFRALRNKTGIVDDVLTVREEDDSTIAWTALVTRGPGDPLTSIDPA